MSQEIGARIFLYFYSSFVFTAAQVQSRNSNCYRFLLCWKRHLKRVPTEFSSLFLQIFTFQKMDHQREDFTGMDTCYRWQC